MTRRMLWSSSTEIVSRANVPFRAPLGYEFSDKDREAYADRFYAMNPELITSGRYAQLWRESGKRGGGVATSMLPIIAIETWLGKKQDRRVIDGSSQLPDLSPLWTSWASASHRRIARVAGIDPKSVRVGYEILSRQGLCEFMTVRCDQSLGRRRTYYRLASWLYGGETGGAGKPKPFRPIYGDLFYGGHWMMLPTNAARHLYFVLAAVDPINQPEIMEGLMEAESLEDRRAKYYVSYAKLETLSGLSRSMLAESLNVLTSPIADNGPYAPYFKRGGRAPFWYVRNQLGWHWNADHLNGESLDIAISRARQWPEVAKRLKGEKLARKIRRERVA